MSNEQVFDVVIVGSGGGAMTAAHLAAKHGLSTVVVERTDRVGGTSAYSGGACWLPGTQVQQRLGISDSTDSARTYLGALLDEPDQAKIEAFLAEAPRLVAELESDDLIEFEFTPFPEYYDRPGRVPGGRSIQPSNIRRDELPAAERVDALLRPPVDKDRVGERGRRTLTGGQALIGRLLGAFLRDGGTVLTGHRMTELVTSEGRVTGIVAETADGPVTIVARRGVVLASGGYEGDAARRAERGVPGSAEWTMAPRGTNQGEPIDAAMAVGAATALLNEGWYCPGLAQPDGSGTFTLGFRSGLMVDQTGQRYANECLPYDRFGREMAKAPERIPSWYLFDNTEGGQLPAIAMPQGDPAAHLAAGTWVQADTVEELAARLGIPAIIATVERFNALAESGVDEEFGRGDDEFDTNFVFVDNGKNKALVPLANGPFYAARFVLSDLGTKGGVVTDAAARALREDGTAIPGLYATSNASASVFGAYYPGPGAPLGSAMVFGSLAVRDLLG
ncbi:FAD-dependent oxidoreductase [Nocardioides daejeonensis]|uniref:FAD-dependent oxidoreductase n=1 Tax=Nocardioides daejeonensis TaxID=1046556 RepID=UPI000D74F78C|nr:FAD-dependent oxidoreductase [Nocardioides daejeonensis]